MRVRKRTLLSKFFNDRGTHLAAMVAYFALLSFVPLVFLALVACSASPTGRTRRTSSSRSSARRSRAARSTSILSLVHRVQDNAATLGIVGGVFLLWSSLSLFSALESALNIVYGRPNRSFLKGKAVAALVMTGSIVTLFLSLVVGAFGVEVLRRYTPGLVGNSLVAYVVSIAVSLLGVFLFLLVIYRVLPNVPTRLIDALPGAIVAAILLEASFQVLPVFVRLAGVNVTLRVLGGPVILLLWLYVMSNVIVFCAELNWWIGERRSPGPDPIESIA